MRVLLDENLPRQLKHLLTGHEVSTTQEIGWAGISDTELLDRSSQHFDALVTADRSLEYQHNIARAGIGIVVVIARNTRVVTIEPLVPAIQSALDNVRPGLLVHVSGRRTPDTDTSD